MMHVHRLIVALLLPLAIVAQAADERLRRTDELIRQSGMSRLFEDFDARIEACMTQGRAWSQQRRGSAPPEAQVRELRKMIRAAFAPERLHATLRDDLATRLSAEDHERMLSWFRSDIFARLEKMDPRSGDRRLQQMQRDPEAYVAALPESRRRAAARVAEAVAPGDELAALMVRLTMESARGFMPSPTPEEARDLEMLRQQLEREAPRMAAAVRRSSTLVLAFVFDTYFTEEEMRRVVGFAETPTYRRFNEATRQAMARALLVAAGDFARLLDGAPPPKRRT